MWFPVAVRWLPLTALPFFTRLQQLEIQTHLSFTTNSTKLSKLFVQLSSAVTTTYCLCNNNPHCTCTFCSIGLIVSSLAIITIIIVFIPCNAPLLWTVRDTIVMIVVYYSIYSIIMWESAKCAMSAYCHNVPPWPLFQALFKIVENQRRNQVSSQFFRFCYIITILISTLIIVTSLTNVVTLVTIVAVHSTYV